MGFDCLACQAVSPQNCIGARQCALFRYLACRNPSGFICTEASFFRAPELD